MKWADAEILLKQGVKISSPRLEVGAYIKLNDSSKYELITPDNEPMDWNPAGSDQLADTWDTLS